MPASLERQPKDDLFMLATAEAAGFSAAKLDEWQTYDVNERRLKAVFDAAVATLDLEAIMVVESKREKPPTQLEKFGLVAVKGATVDYDWSPTIAESGRATVVPPGIATNYRVTGGRARLDAGLGIGLTYDDELAAVAGFGVADNGNARIVQLQAMGRTNEPPRARFRTGLYNGIVWRPTLVRGVLKVAAAAGLPAVEIQGARNNTWPTINGEDGAPFTAGYDDVADFLDFDPDEHGNWVTEV